ncbi:MAG: ATP-dependent helicase HrpB, partial [Caulobacteraceae bacterium]
YLGRDPALRLEAQVVRAVRRALAEETGSLLVFLPGQGEIMRAAGLLEEAIGDPLTDITPLYGALDPREQDRAIAPAMVGRRKVVLATSIAETSLTIEGVRVVIDCGLSRVPRFDPASGLTRLETVRVTQASADQRRGRAGRTEPGVCYRLWEAEETRSLIAFNRPEIAEADLSRLALDLARWGAKDVEGLAFLDPPSKAAMAEARALLRRLQALDGEGALTAHGRAMSGLPVPPRLAHMLLWAAERGGALTAARAAAILSERGLGGKDTDLAHRLERLDRDTGPRAKDAKALAARWAKVVGGDTNVKVNPALVLAEAFPERIARARGKPGEFLLASGRGVFVEPTDALAREQWLAVGELGGGAARDRVLLAAALDAQAVEAELSHLLSTVETVEPDSKGKFTAKRIVSLGSIVVQSTMLDTVDPELIAQHLLHKVRSDGLSVLPWSEAAAQLRARVSFVRGLGGDWPDLSNLALMESLSDWLAPLLIGLRSLGELRSRMVEEALIAAIGWERMGQLDRLAPPMFATPAGTRHPIDYAAAGGPRVEVRVGELYGLNAHPMIGGGKVPLTLSLTSPAGRPLQVTKDLPGFWRGSWREVRTEMRGRYPRHVWPEDPTEAQATTRAKPRGT